jgi:hypothetical protein
VCTACSPSFDFSRSGVLCVLVFVVLGTLFAWDPDRPWRFSVPRSRRAGGVRFRVHLVFPLSLFHAARFRPLPIFSSQLGIAARAARTCFVLVPRQGSRSQRSGLCLLLGVGPEPRSSSSLATSRSCLRCRLKVFAGGAARRQASFVVSAADEFLARLVVLRILPPLSASLG